MFSKKIFSLFYELLVIFSKAQVRSSLSFSIGPSFPIGEYASKNISSSSSGVAKTGQSVSISYTHRLINKQASPLAYKDKEIH